MADNHLSCFLASRSDESPEGNADHLAQALQLLASIRPAALDSSGKPAPSVPRMVAVIVPALSCKVRRYRIAPGCRI